MKSWNLLDGGQELALVHALTSSVTSKPAWADGQRVLVAGTGMPQSVVVVGGACGP
jgi:hypothetical protein